MAKRMTFEELLGKEFRWPQPGDDPFDIEENSRHTALAENDFTRFVLMFEGYRKSADALVDRALDDWREADFLIYPILFLYRHALELNLKYIINVYGHQVGVEPAWNSHNFKVLWPRFLEVLEGFGTDDPDRADQIVGGVIAQFGNVDPGSFSHRYPCDRFGNPIPLVQDRLNLETLKDVMDGVFGFLPERMAIWIASRMPKNGTSRLCLNSNWPPVYSRHLVFKQRMTAASPHAAACKKNCKASKVGLGRSRDGPFHCRPSRSKPGVIASVASLNMQYKHMRHFGRETWPG
jgi:hypothetical protein